MQSLPIELRVGIVPYHTTEELPQTATDAFRDLVRYATTLQPREKVIRLVTELDVRRVG